MPFLPAARRYDSCSGCNQAGGDTYLAATDDPGKTCRTGSPSAHTHACTYLRAYMYTNVHTCNRHTYIHTQIHTHTHTYTDIHTVIHG